jgi:L-alanine-DL-glutamate epimerase-like enolase superfamily enzyme
MKISYRILNLPFSHPFTISKGTKTHQPTLIVQMEWNGLTGVGEAPAISYYNITVEKMAEDLERKRQMVERFALTDPERFWHFLHHLFPDNPFLVCALDMAGWDLIGKLRNQPLYRIWGLDITSGPITDYTIGLDTPEIMAQKVREKPWPVYKVKAGGAGDIDRLNAIRRITNAPIRVDANAGWTLEEAMEKIPAYKQSGVEFIEQPLAKDDLDGMLFLKEHSVLPLIADESCVSEADVMKCAKMFHGVNIKLTKCSGITPARRMLKHARSLGLSTMLGCMNESSIGTAALVHLSPLADYLDADGPLLLASDAASGLNYDHGRITISDKPGLGIDLQITF